MDISIYEPSQAVFDKVINYYKNNANVNIKAIKNPVKLLTYYWAARAIGWGDLTDRIRDLLLPTTPEYQAMEEIDNQVSYNKGSIDRGCEGFVSNFQPLVKKLNDSGIKWTAAKRTPNRYECYKDSKNGLCWTIAYTLEAEDFYGTKHTFKLAKHTNESGGNNYGYMLNEIDYNLHEVIRRVMNELL